MPVTCTQIIQHYFFLGEVELKDQQAKTVTVNQQVQTGETVHQQGVHVHYYAATYYNDCIIGYVLYSKIKLHTNSTDWNNAMMVKYILFYHQ